MTIQAVQPTALGQDRIRQLLHGATRSRVLVIGDVMLDHFLWGTVGRISPEAPVPVLDFVRESFMPGGAGNVARNLTSLETPTELFGVVGKDDSAHQLKGLLRNQGVDCGGILGIQGRPTSVKTRVIAQSQQVVRVDRESREPLKEGITGKLLGALSERLPEASAVVVCDYGKGVVTQPLLDSLKRLCRERAVWLSLDPKPVHHLNLHGLSLITPNRKEAFELANVPDQTRHIDPRKDANLLQTARKLLTELAPAVLLITLGEAGMLLCQRGQRLYHIPTVAQEVFDVSGAGDTVIACFTMAIAAGASALEAAMVSNYAAGIVVGKVGTATVSRPELLGRIGV